LNVQTDETTQGIKFSISVLAALPFIISIIALLAYEINKTLEHVIESELLQRRAS
jgi:Na+/melibiose symporter-like transporter